MQTRRGRKEREKRRRLRLRLKECTGFRLKALTDKVA
jgi:hypothetical protein